jgi:predicted kinase
LDWPVFSSDEIRKTLAGVPLTQRTPLELRAKIYSARMTQQTYNNLLEDGLVALKRNCGTILDATFSTRALRKFLCDKCKKANVPFQFVELEVDPNEIKKRLKARDAKTDETSDARLEDFEKLNATYERPSELAPDLIRVSTTMSVSDAVKAILLCLAGKQSIVANAAECVEPG